MGLLHIAFRVSAPNKKVNKTHLENEIALAKVDIIFEEKVEIYS